MTYLIKTSAAALCLAAMVSAATANAGPAQSQGDVTAVTVTYRDLDITSAQGAHVLYERIQAAATSACTGSPYINLLEGAEAFNKCRTEAIGRALAQVDSPQVWAAAGYDRGRMVASR